MTEVEEFALSIQREAFSEVCAALREIQDDPDWRDAILAAARELLGLDAPQTLP